MKTMKSKKKINIVSTTYLFLLLLRIILVFLPQVGYIHPDEFFQSVDILAGKFLEVECDPPWEFNATSPIRSMALSYFTTGMSYKYLKIFDNVCKEYLPNITVLKPYFLLIVPRLLMCSFSLLVDYSLFKICFNNNEKYKSRLIILSSSYVMLVYATRTFSNSMELVLFSILLYFVSESMTFSNILLRKKEYINFRYEKSQSPAEKASFHKLRLFMVSDSYRNCIYISTITVVGFFNRPTFLGYSVIPIFFWLYRGIGSKTVTVLVFHTRMLVLIVCAMPSILFIILVDSFFYGYITWGEIGMLDISINSFVFTPLNFLKYNTNSDNLAIHGLHPRFLHVLVNIPLLFNILGIYAIFRLLKYGFLCYNKKFNLLPAVRTIKCLMTFSFITPLALLSVFPHQEPRFLVPLIMPLSYLHATEILPDQESAVVEVPKTQLKGLTKTLKSNNDLWKFWLFMNGLLTIFYGFFHQGGVYQATDYLNRDMQLAPLTTDFHVVTSHIYSLPESFFMQKPSNKIYSKGRFQYVVDRRVHLYEEGSKDLELIMSLLYKILKPKGKSRKRVIKLYLIIPSSLAPKLNYLLGQNLINCHLVESFFPHISIETFPELTKNCMDLSGFSYGNCINSIFQDHFWKLFKLNLYQVSI